MDDQTEDTTENKTNVDDEKEKKPADKKRVKPKGIPTKVEETIDGDKVNQKEKMEDSSEVIPIETVLQETVAEEVSMDTDIYDDEAEGSQDTEPATESGDTEVDSDKAKGNKEMHKVKSDSLQEKVQAMQEKVQSFLGALSS